MWWRRFTAALAARLRFVVRALVKGWRLAYALVTVAALAGLSALAAVNSALREPILALVVVLAGLLLTLAEGAYRLYRGVVDARNEEAETLQRQLVDQRAVHQRQLANEQAGHQETRQRAERQQAELEATIAQLQARIRLRNYLVARRNEPQQQVDGTEATVDADALSAPFPTERAKQMVARYLLDWSNDLARTLRDNDLPNEAAEVRCTRAQMRSITSRQHILDAFMDRRDLLDRLLQPDHELWRV